MAGLNGKSATSLLREWMRDRIAFVGEVRVSDLGTEGVRFLAEDQEVLNQFVTEQVYAMAAEIGRAVLLESRRIKRFYEREAETEGQRLERLERWFQRWEHNPVGGYKRLGNMTRHDLLLAAQEREERAVNEVTTARWYRILAEGLLTDEQTVRERYTPEQVQLAWESAGETVLAGLDQIMQGVDETLRRIMRQSEGPGDDTTPDQGVPE